MNKFILGLGCVFVTAVLSCHSGGGDDKPSREMEDYSLGVFSAYMEFRPVHDKLMDSLVQVTRVLLAEKPGAVDTNSLRVLLNNARAARETGLELMKDVKEVDSTIGLKDSLVAYLNAAKQFYDSGYDKLLSLTVIPRRKDSVAALGYVRAEMRALVARRKSWLATYQAFKEKYGIETYAPAAENSSAPVPLPVARKVDTARFPMQAVVVERDESAIDLRLPYTMLITTDSGRQYLILGTYNGEQIGFGLWMKSGGFGVTRLTTIGKASDRFLSVFQKLYGMEVDKMSHFADTVRVDCISMGAYVDSLKKSGQGEYETTAQNKLFFESNDTLWEAECYLNINPSEHWVELKEKEAEYQAKSARDLSRRN